MPVSFKCPGCGHRYNVPYRMAGRTAGCKDCGIKLVIPPNSDTPAQRAEAPPPPRKAPPPPPAPLAINDEDESMDDLFKGPTLDELAPAASTAGPVKLNRVEPKQAGKQGKARASRKGTSADKAAEAQPKRSFMERLKSAGTRQLIEAAVILLVAAICFFGGLYLMFTNKVTTIAGPVGFSMVLLSFVFGIYAVIKTCYGFALNSVEREDRPPRKGVAGALWFNRSAEARFALALVAMLTPLTILQAGMTGGARDVVVGIMVVIAVLAGAGMMMIASLWLVTLAFRDDVIVGLMYMFVPLYALYFVVTRWEYTRRPLTLCLVAVGVLCWVTMAIVSAEHADARLAAVGYKNAMNFPMPAMPPLPEPDRKPYNDYTSYVVDMGRPDGSTMTAFVMMTDIEVPPASRGCLLLPAEPAGPLFGGYVELKTGRIGRVALEKGLVLVTYSLAGAPPSPNSLMTSQGQAKKFIASGAGLVDARLVVEFVRTRLPMVDSSKIYIAGSDLAANIAIHTAAHVPEIRGVVALAPYDDVVDVANRMDPITLGSPFMPFVEWWNLSDGTASLRKQVVLIDCSEYEDVARTRSGFAALAKRLQMLGAGTQTVNVSNDEIADDYGSQACYDGLLRLDPSLARTATAPPANAVAARPPHGGAANNPNLGSDRGARSLRGRQSQSPRTSRPQPAPEAPKDAAALAAELVDNPYVVKRSLIELGAEAEPHVLPYVDHHDRRTRAAAVDVLAEIGTEKSVPALIERLSDEVSVAAPAEKALRRIKPEVVDDVMLMLAKLRSTRAHDQRAGATALARMPVHEKYHDAVAAELERLAVSVDNYMRDDFAKALVRWKRTESQAVLIDMVDHERARSDVRDVVLPALADYGDDASAAAITQWLIEEPDTVVAALTNMGEVAERHVTPLLQHGDTDVKRNAVRILTQVGTRQSVADLTRLARNRRDYETSRLATEAVREITRRIREQRIREAQEAKEAAAATTQDEG